MSFKLSRSLANCLMISLVALALTACGGGSSSSDPVIPAPKFALLKLGLTDGPIDAAAKVVVVFNGVTIKPASGSEIEFTFDEPKSIDLLALQGTLSEVIIEEVVEAGDYNWIRLAVSAELDGELDSYIEFEDGAQHELFVPSGSQSGLKLNKGFTAAADGTVDLTIDFDLRKSITKPNGQDGYFLKPSLRLIDNLEVGSLVGLISSETLNEYCADPSLEIGAVYLYTGADVTPQDIQGNDEDPLTTALVELNSNNDYAYEIGFIPAGDYTATYTCEAVDDEAEEMNDITFVGTTNVTISATQETQQDF